ncbi:hypothetical protein [Sphingomonas jeddahensis]|uniref:hypothetical protein n=1 Tax=Sphingomonas jeddahensis TaxID=1915074 RepID=UPI0011817882|nr:hypothetical protein [Sphingomonas jeddahensis]
MRRLSYSAFFITFGVGIGKSCQYAAVGYLGAQMGSELASLVGLAPFIITLAALKARYPRYFTLQSRVS